MERLGFNRYAYGIRENLEEVKRLRQKLEQLTNKQPIPVWHKSRGKEAYLQDVANYDYIAFAITRTY